MHEKARVAEGAELGIWCPHMSKADTKPKSFVSTSSGSLEVQSDIKLMLMGRG